MAWINIKDRQPPLNERVLVMPYGRNIVISQLIDEEELALFWRDDDKSTYDLITVGWWQFLPSEEKKSTFELLKEVSVFITRPLQLPIQLMLDRDYAIEGDKLYLSEHIVKTKVR